MKMAVVAGCWIPSCFGVDIESSVATALLATIVLIWDLAIVGVCCC